MEAYFDNSATTKCLESVGDLVVKTLMEDYGNPSAKHMKGVEAERYLKTAREEIAKTLKGNEKEIYFTSGGTESNNWALIGTAMANRRKGNHIISTAIEHPAVIQPLLYLEEQGFSITWLKPDRDGIVSVKDLEEALTEKTILVSVMFVNNELGSVQPIEEIGKRLKDRDILFHVDAIQAYGKLPVAPKRMGIDLLSVSGHKIHGPKGVGFLYVRDGVKIKPLILGGGQQKGMRSGTDNVPGAAGLGEAAKAAYENLEAHRETLFDLKSYFIEGIQELEGVQINSRKDEKGAPHIVSVSFAGVRSEVLLHALEEKEIYVSSGSACSSNKKMPFSTVLKEIGLKAELLDATIRFSFSVFNTREEIDYCLGELKALLPMLRKYTRH